MQRITAPASVILFLSGSYGSLSAEPSVPAIAGDASRIILWDGEAKSTGVGWVSPVADDMAISSEKGVGTGESTGVSFRMARPNLYLESGWQWSDWSNVVTTDFKPYDILKLSVKFAGPRLPDDLSLQLASPGDHKTTQRLSLKKYEAAVLDGEWHELSIPLQDFYTDDMPFDAAHAHQLIFETWNDNKDFKVFLDNILLAKD